MNLEGRVDLVWRLNHWYELLNNDPDLVQEEIGNYLVTKEDQPKKDDPDIAAAKERHKAMEEEVKKRDKAIREDPGR